MSAPNVSHPSHYNAGKIEVIEFIEDQFPGVTFHLANAIKYISRAGKKDPGKEIEDLEKAIWYLKRAVEVLKAKKEGRAPVRPNDMNPRTGIDLSKFSEKIREEARKIPGYSSAIAASGSDRAESPPDTAETVPDPLDEICSVCLERRGRHRGGPHPAQCPGSTTNGINRFLSATFVGSGQFRDSEGEYT